MPCNMHDGANRGDFAKITANNAKRDVEALTLRVAELEQALCGLCQMFDSIGHPSALPAMHPQLRQWFEKHKRRPGCEAG